MKQIPLYFQQFRFGVRQRLVLTLLGSLLISLTVNGWLLLQEQAESTDSEISHNGNQLSQIISRSLANAVVGYDYHGIQLFIDEVARGDIEYIVVTSKKGNTMAQTGNTTTDDSKVRVFESDIMLQDNKVGHVRIGLNTQPIINKIEAQKNSLVSREAAVILFILLIEFAALSLLIVRPLSRIYDALVRNADNNGMLPAEIEIGSRDEFGDIAKKFNQMRAQLNKAHQALQGKVEIADEQLRIANQKLKQESELLEKSNRELQNQAFTDPLTGLANRRKFQDLMKSGVAVMMSSGETISLVILDIDRFKTINDKYGHDAGDDVLREIAGCLADNIRKSDELCRIGGEEFALFCYDADLQGALNIAAKLRKAVEEHAFSVDDGQLHVTISLGIATFTVDRYIHCPDCLYRQADIALYQSKLRGRNRVTHFCDVNLEEVEGLDQEVIDEIRRA